VVLAAEVSAPITVVSELLLVEIPAAGLQDEIAAIDTKQNIITDAATKNLQLYFLFFISSSISYLRLNLKKITFSYISPINM
jgi:hypothetical protein